jgi:hypothetical protein
MSRKMAMERVAVTSVRPFDRAIAAIKASIGNTRRSAVKGFRRAIWRAREEPPFCCCRDWQLSVSAKEKRTYGQTQH